MGSRLSKVLLAVALGAACGAILWLRPWRSHEAPPATTASPPEPTPQDLGPLPDMCRPWRAPVSRRLSVSENPVIPGLRSDRLSCTDSGGFVCDAFSSLNASRYASRRVFWKGPDGERLPYGGGHECFHPMTDDRVTCQVNVNDPDFNTVEVVTLSCRGDRLCGDEPGCCSVTGRKKVFVRHVEPSDEEKARWERERCDILHRRRVTCSRFCSDPRYSKDCSEYWTHEC